MDVQGEGAGRDKGGVMGDQGDLAVDVEGEGQALGLALVVEGHGRAGVLTFDVEGEGVSCGCGG